MDDQKDAPATNPNECEGHTRELTSSSSSPSRLDFLNENQWMDFYNQLVQYKTHNKGKIMITWRQPEHTRLAVWVSLQQHRSNLLSIQQRSLLTKLGLDLNLFDKASERRWSEHFVLLLEYKLQNGHCRVPRRYEQDTSLGQWVGRQRILHKNGKLEQHRADILEEIGVDFSTSRTQNMMFNVTGTSTSSSGGKRASLSTTISHTNTICKRQRTNKKLKTVPVYPSNDDENHFSSRSNVQKSTQLKTMPDMVRQESQSKEKEIPSCRQFISYHHPGKVLKIGNDKKNSHESTSRNIEIQNDHNDIDDDDESLLDGQSTDWMFRDDELPVWKNHNCKG